MPSLCVTTESFYLFSSTYRDGEHIVNEMHHIRAHDGREFSLSGPVAHIQLTRSL